MFKDFSLPTPTPWLERFWQDLQPTPERLSKALRMTFSSLVVLVLMLVLQMPYVAYGLYFIFLIGRESPSVSLRTAFASVVTIVVVIVSEMGVVILSDNDPMARVLSVVIASGAYWAQAPAERRARLRALSRPAARLSRGGGGGLSRPQGPLRALMDGWSDPHGGEPCAVELVGAEQGLVARGAPLAADIDFGFDVLEETGREPDRVRQPGPPVNFAGRCASCRLARIRRRRPHRGRPSLPAVFRWWPRRRSA